MCRRTISAFLFIAVFSGLLAFRLAYISGTLAYQTDTVKSTRYIAVDETRGMIYDRYMRPLVNLSGNKLLFVNPTDSACEYLKSVLDKDSYDSISANLSAMRPFTFVCDSYNGVHDDIIELSRCVRYAEDSVAVHLTGYIDSQGDGICGIEKDFDGLLRQYSGSMGVRYTASASGTALSGLGFELVSDNYEAAGGIRLTIDSEIQRICENAMEYNGLEKGAVVVLDVNTSAVLAMASAPEYDRNNIAQFLDDSNRPFINRALSAYPVGSVFKPVVAVAALEAGISPDTCFECTGGVEISGVVFNCHNRQGHGAINMTQAMAASCNSYFIQLGQQTGSKAILDAAVRLGLGKEIRLSDSVISSSGILPDVDSAPALANLSFGQGELLATPLQIAEMYCVFASQGIYSEPYVTDSVIDNNGEATDEAEVRGSYRVISEGVCQSVNKMLAATVSEGSGNPADPMCCDAAGKTATAETGKYENGEKKVHTWFAGYFPANEPEYVIVVFREDGNYSSTDCAPVFRDIADALKNE